MAQDIINKAATPLDLVNKIGFTVSEELAAKFNEINSNKAISNAEVKISNNVIILTDGEYPALVTTKPNTNISGRGDVIFTSSRTDSLSTAAELTLDNRVEGARFQGTVHILNNATAIFQNCVFTNIITVAVGANAHFIGCLFQDEGRVLNSGTAYIIGCSRKNPLAHVGITTTFGETV